MVAYTVIGGAGLIPRAYVLNNFGKLVEVATLERILRNVSGFRGHL